MIGSLFSGIGGLDLGLERAGLGPVRWQVESDPYCRKILAKHWPDAERFFDVRDVGTAELAAVDLICGGFPCQDLSIAGKGEGLAGSRSGLWSEFARIIDELRPGWVVIENVSAGAAQWLGPVVRDLGLSGYESLPVPLSAADVGAPHRRRRLFVIAYSEREHLRNQSERMPGRWPRELRASGEAESAHDGNAGTLPRSDDSDSSSAELERHRSTIGGRSPDFDPQRPWSQGSPVSPVCRVDDGIPNRVDRLRCLGNAVVPQCAEVIGWMVREMALAC